MLTVDKFVFEKTPENPYSLDDLDISEQELLDQIEDTTTAIWAKVKDDNRATN